jgi:hypothetical protein
MPRELFAAMVSKLQTQGELLSRGVKATEDAFRLRVAKMLAVFVYYLSRSIPQDAVAERFGISQPTVSRWLRCVARALLRLHGEHGCDPQIGLHNLAKTVNRIEPDFFELTHVRYLALIADGFHVPVARPSAQEHLPEDYLCREKGYLFSINCMLMCDPQKYICFGEPRWPGAVNDRGMTARSPRFTEILTHRHPHFPRPFSILADGGFHMRSPFVLPFGNDGHDETSLDPALTARNKRDFNYAICAVRVRVEQCIGLLKGTRLNVIVACCLDIAFCMNNALTYTLCVLMSTQGSGAGLRLRLQRTYALFRSS